MAVAPATGNQWARILVPSNEVIVQSEATPGTGVALTGLATGRWQAGGFHEALELAAPAVDDAETAEAAASSEPTSATLSRRMGASRSRGRRSGRRVGPVRWLGHG